MGKTTAHKRKNSEKESSKKNEYANRAEKKGSADHGSWRRSKGSGVEKKKQNFKGCETGKRAGTRPFLDFVEPSLRREGLGVAAPGFACQFGGLPSEF